MNSWYLMYFIDMYFKSGVIFNFFIYIYYLEYKFWSCYLFVINIMWCYFKSNWINLKVILKGLLFKRNLYVMNCWDK